MEILNDGRIRFRVKITGHIKGVLFEYTDPEGSEGSQFVHPPDAEGNIGLSEYWWSEGNMACDCNRSEFVNVTPETHPFLSWENGEVVCGHHIRITAIVPAEPIITPWGELNLELHLNEE